MNAALSQMHNKVQVGSQQHCLSACIYKRTHDCQFQRRINTLDCCRLWAILMRHRGNPYRLRLVVSVLPILDCLCTSSCVDTISADRVVV